MGWLLRSKDPSVRYFTLRDVLREQEQSREVMTARRQITEGSRVRALLSGQRIDGGFGVHQYRKWSGGHWRLVSAVELGVTSENKVAVKAAKRVLAGLSRLRPPKVAELWRSHASEPGNAVGVGSKLGLAEDPIVKKLASSLVEWQWPDGGWNCDSAPDARHSSFYESLSTLWGLNEYSRATDDSDVKEAVQRAAQFFLKHRLFRSCSTGGIINLEWLKLHYPLYWHYDILQALRILSLTGNLRDSRTAEALDIVQSKRSEDGTWRPEGYYWRPRLGARPSTGTQPSPNTEVVDWGREGPNEMITLNALRVLVGSRRIS